MGWKVLFLGTGALGADALRFPTHPNIVVRQLPFCPAGWRQKFHYVWFCFLVIGWAIRWRPQWIYASDLLSCPVTLLLSYFSDLQVVYHEHDSPGNPFQSLWMHFCLWSRRKLALRAKLCILPNEPRAAQFEKEMDSHGNVLWVWNCPSIEEVSSVRPPHQGNNLKILYHGSIVPARLPSAFIEALMMLPKNVRLCIVGYETVGSHGYIRKLQELALKRGVGNQIEFVGTIPTRNGLMEYCRNCDIGLALMPRGGKNFNEQTMAGASNKPFDYLANGLAVLVSDLPDWKEMYVETGYGLACDPDDPKSIASALCRFLEHPEEMREMGERGRQRILAEWNYEQQFAPILKRMCQK